MSTSLKGAPFIFSKLPSLKVSLKSRNFTDICMGWGGGGDKCLLQIFLQSYIVARLGRITFKRGKFTNFRALFAVVPKDFRINWPMSKVEKNRGR